MEESRNPLFSQEKGFFLFRNRKQGRVQKKRGRPTLSTTICADDPMTTGKPKTRLAAILIADVQGYSPLKRV